MIKQHAMYGVWQVLVCILMLILAFSVLTVNMKYHPIASILMIFV